MTHMDDHLAISNAAFATRQNYIRSIKLLMIHYQKLPEQCTVEQIRAFLKHQRDHHHISASTLNMRVCGLKYYFRHVVLRPDLVVNIPNPRIQKYQTEVLTIRELNHLFNCCRDMRQVLILHLMYDSGIRVRELIRLRPGDFDKHYKSISIRNSKGNKTRVVKYGDRLRDTLNKYCKVMGGVPRNTLIESYKDKGSPLSLGGVQHIVKEIVKRSGIKKRIHPHTFRHTFAVHYLNRGGSLFRLQQLLGHQTITTTLHYLNYANLPEGIDISVLDNMP